MRGASPGRRLRVGQNVAAVGFACWRTSKPVARAKCQALDEEMYEMAAERGMPRPASYLSREVKGGRCNTSSRCRDDRGPELVFGMHLGRFRAPQVLCRFIAFEKGIALTAVRIETRAPLSPGRGRINSSATAAAARSDRVLLSVDVSRW